MYSLCKTHRLNNAVERQLQRASLSVMLNIAEGNGRFTKPDQRHFYVMARSSAFECSAIFDLLLSMNIVDEKTITKFQGALNELSAILYTMIKNLEKPTT